MDLVGRDLDEPADAQSAYRLAGVLEQAVRASNAQFEDPEVLERLRVRVTPHAGGEQSGWDVFSLEYAASAPLTTVFTAEAAKKYLRAFTFLWRLKRVEHALCATADDEAQRHRGSAEGRRERRRGGRSRTSPRCHTLRGEMHHFVSNLQYYVMFEVRRRRERFRREMREARISTTSSPRTTGTSTPSSRNPSWGPSQLRAGPPKLFESVLRFRPLIGSTSARRGDAASARS